MILTHRQYELRCIRYTRVQRCYNVVIVLHSQSMAGSMAEKFVQNNMCGASMGCARICATSILICLRTLHTAIEIIIVLL